MSRKTNRQREAHRLAHSSGISYQQALNLLGGDPDALTSEECVAAAVQLLVHAGFSTGAVVPLVNELLSTANVEPPRQPPSYAPYPTRGTEWSIIPLGVDAEGQEVNVNVNVYPHMLVGGETGAGKSVLQRTILMHVLQSPMWRVGLIDPKRVELSQYASARNVMKIATELEESAELLEFVEQMMQKRYLQMKSEGVNHFTMLSTPPPAFLLMIDEVFPLLTPVKNDEEVKRNPLTVRCNVLIGSLVRLGRAAGIHLILATQRPDAKIIPGEIRANLDCRIAVGKMPSTPSLMVLDSDAATKLPGGVRGRAVIRKGNDYTEFQIYFPPNEVEEGESEPGKD